MTKLLILGLNFRILNQTQQFCKSHFENPADHTIVIHIQYSFKKFCSQVPQLEQVSRDSRISSVGAYSKITKATIHQV